MSYSTYLGGSGFRPHIAVDASGHAYVTGRTSSPNFPITPGAFQPTFDLENNNGAFVVKFALATGPDTTLTASPPNSSNSSSASFSFTATEAGSGFECQLDGGALPPAAAPRATAG